MDGVRDSIGGDLFPGRGIVGVDQYDEAKNALQHVKDRVLSMPTMSVSGSYGRRNGRLAVDSLSLPPLSFQPKHLTPSLSGNLLSL